MKTKLLATALASSVALAGCTTATTTANNTYSAGKTALGALAGAAAGYGISKATGGEENERDAIIGAVVGAGVSAYMQKQASQLETQLEGTGVEVELDTTTNDINITMPSNITFDTDSSAIKSAFTGTLQDLATTMKQYDQTSVVVMGHTDSDGSASYNQTLSEKRAYSVAKYLYNNGVASSRISTIGYGETQPIASNATEAGKAQNRRVEIKINAPSSLS